MIIGLSSTPQTTMFNCSKPTKRRLYLQPMLSFRAVIAGIRRERRGNKIEGQNGLKTQENIPSPNGDSAFVTMAVKMYPVV